MATKKTTAAKASEDAKDEAVVAAEVEAVAAEKAAASAKDKSEDTTAAKPSAPAEKKKPKKKNTIERCIADDNDIVVEAESAGVNQKLDIAEIQHCIDTGSITYAKVVGVETVDEKIRIILKRKTIRIVIPAEDFFACSIMRDIENDTPENRFIRYRRKASHMFGAAVSLVPIAIDYTEDDVPFVVASRRLAMETNQDLHFFGPNPDAHVDAVAKASIITVGPKYIIVECLGVESIINVGALSAFYFIDDVRHHFKIGESIKVKITKLEVDSKKRKIDISLSRAEVERAEAHVECANESMMKGRYQAKITNVRDEYYVAVLNDFKINALIRKENVVNGDVLEKNDDVILLVTGVNIEKNFVLGSCLKVEKF